MTKTTDKLREYFNQSPAPKSKFLKETRDKINSMIDDVEQENSKLKALLISAYYEFIKRYGTLDDMFEYADRMKELGIDVKVLDQE